MVSNQKALQLALWWTTINLNVVVKEMDKQSYSYNGIIMARENISRRSRSSLKRDNSQALNLAIVLVSCFLMGRAFIFEGIAPFGVAFFAVMLKRPKGRMAAFIAIIIGMVSVGVGGFILKYAGAMGLFFLLFNVWGDNRVFQNNYVMAFCNGGILFAANMIYNGLAPGGILSYDYILASFESAIAFVLIFVFDNVLSLVLDAKKRRILSNEEMISMGIFFTLLIIGIWDVNFYGLSLRNIFSVLFIIVTAYVGGIGIGATMGILMGLVLSMASGPDPTLIAGLGVCGLIAGTFRDLGKVFTGFSFLLANALMALYISKSTIPILSFQEIMISTGLLILIPNKALAYIRQFLDYSLMRFKEQNYYIKRMQELTVARLNEFSKVFGELSSAFNQISSSTETGQDEITKLLDIIASQVCSSCPLYGNCWKRDFHGTYNEMFHIITAIESQGQLDESHIRGELAKKCIHIDKLVDTINKVYGLYKSNLKWRGKIQESRQLVAQQLDGVSGVINQLAKELDINIHFKKELEDSIQLELDKVGIRTKEILVIEKPGGKLEISIHKRTCGGRRDCSRKIQGIITRLTGKKMTSNASACTALGKEECLLKLVEAQELDVMTGIARKAGGSSGICGDSYSFNSLADGKYMLALSDGMGIGRKAEHESSVVVSLLENFLSAGFQLDITIRTINSILLLRSQEEMFATADLCLLDLVSGRADFVKIGAVATFIKREDYVEVIKASSLPIGILDNVQSEIASTRIRDGDIIVMITDGVMDNAHKGDKAEEWLTGTIGNLDTRNPQDMADKIMEAVLREGTVDKNKLFGDDMTIMVSRVWKSFS